MLVGRYVNAFVSKLPDESVYFSHYGQQYEREPALGVSMCFPKRHYGFSTISLVVRTLIAD